MLESCIAYSRSLRGVAADYPFGPSPLVMKIEGKMFALFGGEGSGATVSLKCDPIIAENLREQHAGIRPGYHLNKKHWNTVDLDGSLSFEEVCDMIEHSYRLVLASLPKHRRNQYE
jgi:predicted DNA-binding protein (MmcQ/YjbR family)